MLPEEKNEVGEVVCAVFHKGNDRPAYLFRISATEIERNTAESLGYLLKSRLDDAADSLRKMKIGDI